MSVSVTRETSIISELRGRDHYPGAFTFGNQTMPAQQMQGENVERIENLGEYFAINSFENDSNATQETAMMSEMGEDVTNQGNAGYNAEIEEEEEGMREGNIAEDDSNNGASHYDNSSLEQPLPVDSRSTAAHSLSPKQLLTSPLLRALRVATGAGSIVKSPTPPRTIDMDSPGDTSASCSSSGREGRGWKLLRRRQSSSASTLLGAGSPFLTSLRTPASAETDNGRGRRRNGQEANASTFSFYPLKPKMEKDKENEGEEREGGKRLLKILNVYGLWPRGRQEGKDLNHSAGVTREEELLDLSEEKQLCLLDNRGNNALLLAARLQDWPMLQRLLQAGWEQSVKNAYGETLLHLVVGGRGKSNAFIAPALLSRLAEGLMEEGGWNTRTAIGRTPWLEAAVCGNVLGLEALWEGGGKRGLEIEAVDNEGRNALHLAVMYKKEEVVEWLTSMEWEAGNWKKGWRRGLLLEGRDREGMTPLHLAAMFNSPRMAACMVRKGGAESGAAENARHETPVDVAERFGHTWTRRALESILAEGEGEGTEAEAVIESPTVTKARLQAGGEGGREGGGEGGQQVRMRVGGTEVCLDGPGLERIEVLGGCA